jgi:hypothetical protein
MNVEQGLDPRLAFSRLHGKWRRARLSLRERVGALGSERAEQLKQVYASVRNRSLGAMNADDAAELAVLGKDGLFRVRLQPCCLNNALRLLGMCRSSPYFDLSSICLGRWCSLWSRPALARLARCSWRTCRRCE